LAKLALVRQAALTVVVAMMFVAVEVLVTIVSAVDWTAC
jgi:hypothetical protein